MSKIFENKTMLIHIAAEIIVIIGLSFYFSQKNKKLMGHINDLIQRIEDQEDMIQKHEQLINNLTNALNDINSKISNNKNLPLQAESITNNKNIKLYSYYELIIWYIVEHGTPIGAEGFVPVILFLADVKDIPWIYIRRSLSDLKTGYGW